MKHIIALICVLSFFATSFSQDLIVKMDDDEIIARIEAIKKQKIFYRQYENPDGDLLKIPKSQVYMVIYEDGLKQYFSIETSQEVIQESRSDSAGFFYDRGVADAKRFFENNGPFWGTFAASALPIYGINGK